MPPAGPAVAEAHLRQAADALAAGDVGAARRLALDALRALEDAP